MACLVWRGAEHERSESIDMGLRGSLGLLCETRQPDADEELPHPVAFYNSSDRSRPKSGNPG